MQIETGDITPIISTPIDSRTLDSILLRLDLGTDAEPEDTLLQVHPFPNYYGPNPSLQAQILRI